MEGFNVEKILGICNTMHNDTKDMGFVAFASMIGMIVDDYCYNHGEKQDKLYSYLNIVSQEVDAEFGTLGICVEQGRISA